VPNFHSSKQSSVSKIDLTATGTSAAGDEKSLGAAKAHGILMIIAWMFFVPNAIIVARYFKSLFPEKKLLGTKIWFTIHRPSMIFSVVITLVSFIVILTHLNWEWIKSDESLNFAHSIFGIFVICAAVIQVKNLVLLNIKIDYGFKIIKISIKVFFTLLRCSPTHSKRYIFNWFHRITGISTFICAG